MLHDIICFANNIVDRDCYIIIGADENDYSLYDVKEDKNRINTNNIVDFIRKVEFSYDIRPFAYVETIIIDEIDILIIKIR